MDLTIYQYNAYCEGYKLKQTDDLASRIEAAYWNAYWNGGQKHKKSLNTVIKSLYRGFNKKKKASKPIDVKAVEKEFAAMEGLRNYGWIKN